MADRFETVAITVEFDGDHAVVELGGSAGPSASRMLGSMLSDLVDDGVVDLVVSLGGLEPIDVGVRQVIAGISTRLVESDGHLIVRASVDSAASLRADVGPHVRFEHDVVRVTTLGTEQQNDDESLRVMSEPASHPDRWWQTGSRLTDESIDGAFHRLTVLAADIVAGAHGASVTFERAGRMMTAASSNDTVLRMDRHQYDTAEGPCLSAAAEGRWFHTPSLQHEERWPAFTPLAMSDGIASVLSTPIMVAARPVGALNIYSSHEHVFGTTQQRLAAALATHAAGVLYDIAADEEMQERTRDAMHARSTIALAQGVLMERTHVTANQAMSALMGSARDSDITVRQHAHQVIDTTGPVGGSPEPADVRP